MHTYSENKPAGSARQITKKAGVSFATLYWDLKEEAIIPVDAFGPRSNSNRRHFVERRRSSVLPARNRGLRDANHGSEIRLRQAKNLGANVLQRAHVADNMRKRILFKRKISANAFLFASSRD